MTNDMKCLPEWAQQEIRKLRKENQRFREVRNKGASEFETLPSKWQAKIRELRRENARLRYRLNHGEQQ